MIYWLLKYGLGWLGKAVWIKEVSGLHHIPKEGPIILAANHSSYFDFLTMIMVCPRKISFLAAEVFYKNAFMRFLMNATGQIKVDRTEKEKDEIFEPVSELLRSGGVFGIFPEGTRSRTGKLQKAYKGVARISRENRVAVVPVAIKGAHEIMSPKDKFPKLKKEIELHFLPALELDHQEEDLDFVHKRLMPCIARQIGQSYDFN